MSRMSQSVENQEKKEQAESVHVSALCRVDSFDPARMTVNLQPLSKALDGGVYRTQPPILNVPVALVRGGGLVFRPWYQAGDVGVVVYLDHDIDRIAEAGQECQPNTERNHGSEDAVFIGAFAPASNPVTGLPESSLVMGTEGGSVYIAISAGGIAIKGDITLEGNMTATGDVKASGKSLATHTHTGVHGETSGPN